MNPINVIASVAPFILILFLALWIFLWGGHARALRKERKRHEEALKALDALRRQLEAMQPARGADPAPGVPQTQAELEQKAAAFDRFGQLPVELPAGHVRADTCPPGMVEVKLVMPPGYDEMGKAMSAHEGGNGKGVSLVDQHKNSASHLGGD